MARIYYKEKALCGEPYETPTLNIDSFRRINDNPKIPQKTSIEVLSARRSRLAHKIFKKEIFGFAVIHADDFEYCPPERNVYIPSSIIFYDNNDHNFPSDFYFVARIDNQIEVRQCKGGEDIKWYHIPELHRPVRNKKIIKKIERTVVELIKLVSKEFEISDNEIFTNLQRESAALTPLDINQKLAFRRLGDIFIKDNVENDKVRAIIESMDDCDDECDTSTLFEFIERLEDQELSFILDFDHKLEVKEFHCLVSEFVGKNFRLVFDLPDPCRYGDISISGKGVLDDYDKALRKHGLQFSFIDDFSDSYVVLIHHESQREDVKAAVLEIGYECYEVRDIGGWG